ncbi:hypothetical protein Tco_0541634, partial [Tanacetum coccineum]
VSNAEVAAGISIGEIGTRVFAIEGQVHVMASVTPSNLST